MYHGISINFHGTGLTFNFIKELLLLSMCSCITLKALFSKPKLRIIYVFAFFIRFNSFYFLPYRVGKCFIAPLLITDSGTTRFPDFKTEEKKNKVKVIINLFILSQYYDYIRTNSIYRSILCSFKIF